MNTKQIIAAVIGAIALLIGLGWIIRYNDLATTKVFAPKYEEVRRETFEQSKSYNRGTIQNLRDAQMNYISAPADRRAGLGSVIIQQYADYPDDKLPNDLRAFMSCLRNHQGQEFNCAPGAN